jgi:Txe/YoeB family toxin of toxin-antitoxin system
VNWNVVFARHALKDANKLEAAGLKENAVSLIEVLRKNPFQRPPPYEKLIGNLAGTYSRRINIQHRLVYEVFKDQKTVRILRMWSHYE